tara:strand:- start:5372 stop:7249 length:1878 start_codon:yes stop_codon:yes gene_type:complete
MTDDKKFIDYKIFQKIFYITILLVVFKWIFSYFFFDEAINLRIVNEIYDGAYIPLIKTYSEFNFNPSYSENLSNLKILAYPVLSLLVNSFFYKIFGSYSFILLEFLCVFLFISIFYLIFTELKFSKYSSITYSIFLFILPTIFFDLAILEIKQLKLASVNFGTFYSLRVPRPIISNLFLFSFIYFIFKFYLSKENNLKIVLPSVIIMAFTVHIFFYFFTFQLLLISLIYLDKFKLNVFSFIKKNIRIHILFLSIILLSFLVFFYQVNLSEPDIKQYMGLVEIDLSKKIILLKYLVNFLTRIEFLLLFLTSSIFFIYLKNDTIKVFYYFFISTIISTILFIMSYNKGIDYYHFFNWILASGLLHIIITGIYLFDTYLFEKIVEKKKIILNIFLIIIFVTYYSSTNSLKQINQYKQNFNERIELKNLVNFYTQNKNIFIKTNEVLTMNVKFSLWLILNDFNNLSIVPVSFWTPKKNSRVEAELISAFKKLNLNENDLINFLSNKKKTHKYKNEYTGFLFDRKYLANRLITFDNKKLYTDEEKKFIEKNSPIITHQLIIPQNEFSRIKNKFKNTNTVIDPDVIVLDFQNKVINKKKIKKNIYCLAYDSDNYEIFVKRTISSDCKIFKK